MKRVLKPREIALLAIPVVALGLFALLHGPASKPPGSRQEQEEAIEEAALVRELEGKSGQLAPRTIYISVGGQDAAPTFAARLARRGIVLRPFSETSLVKKGIEDVVIDKSGALSSRFTVEGVEWNSDASASVNISVFTASLFAGGSNFNVKWNGEKWLAEEGEVRWVS